MVEYGLAKIARMELYRVIVGLEVLGFVLVI